MMKSLLAVFVFLLAAPLSAQTTKADTTVRVVPRTVTVYDTVRTITVTTLRDSVVIPPKPPVVDTTVTPPPVVAAGCSATDLVCDDFEDGSWYEKDCDAANASGGLAQTDGWCGTIYGKPTPALCGNQGYKSNCAAVSVPNYTYADHSLSKSVNEAYIRAEKLLTLNKGPAGVGGIYFGNLHVNCGAGSAKASGQLAWQPTAPSTLSCYDLGIITLVPDHWYYVEVRINVTGKLLQVWANDCGTGQGNCTGTPTLRLNLTGYAFAPGTLGSVWFENWSNPESSGRRLIDNVRVSTTRVGF